MARRKKAQALPGMGLWTSMAGMAFEASQVIPLRLMKIAAGGTAGEKESRQMVQEKLLATQAAMLTLAGGGSAETVVRQLHRKVRANRKRLSR